MKRALWLPLALVACTDAGAPKPDASTACVPMSITVAPATPSVPAGMTVQLAATLICASGETRDVSTAADWQTFDTFTATVSSSGLVTAKKAGMTTITASAATVMGMARLTVTPP